MPHVYIHKNGTLGFDSPLRSCYLLIVYLFLDGGKRVME